MTAIARLSRLTQHFLTFVFYFAHGGFVMAGVIVFGLIGYQLTQFGADGLNPRSMFGYHAGSGGGASEIALLDVVYEDVTGTRLEGLSAGFSRVSAAIAKRHRVSPVVLESLIRAAQHEGQNNGIDPLLILAVVTVESGFNPFAESVVGAQGLMQIIPKFHAEKISSDKGAAALFDPAENIRVGALIIKEYLRASGNIESALQIYGGASGDAEMVYSGKVLQEYERLRQIYGNVPAERSASVRQMQDRAG